MSYRARTLAREFAAALAVAAVYVLVLLAPLHQAAGLQKDLAGLGYDQVDSWSLCVAATPDNDSERSANDLKCPAAGIGKSELAAVELDVIPFAFEPVAGPVFYEIAPVLDLSTLPARVKQARAPPVIV